LKHVNVTQWVRERTLSNPTRSKASHRVGSRTEVRSPRGGVRSRGKARTQAVILSPENGMVVDSRIGPGNRTQSRRFQSIGRQQSSSRQGKRAGHHRGLRAGHAFRGVTRELGRASRLHGKHRRSKGDRRNQHPGASEPTPFAGEPTLARAERDTKQSASTQGTGREPKADRPGWTEAVVATHSTAGQGIALARTRGEPRPKGPTITLARAREGNARYDVCAPERQRGLRAHRLSTRKGRGVPKSPASGACGWMGSTSHVACGLISCRLLASEANTDEPYEGNLHVRVCGGRRGTTPAPTRQPMRRSAVRLVLYPGVSGALPLKAHFPSPLFMVTVLGLFLSIFSCSVVQSPQVIDTPESCGACSGYRPLRCIRRAPGGPGPWTIGRCPPWLRA